MDEEAGRISSVLGRAASGSRNCTWNTGRQETGHGKWKAGLDGSGDSDLSVCISEKDENKAVESNSQNTGSGCMCPDSGTYSVGDSEVIRGIFLLRLTERKIYDKFNGLVNIN